MKNEYNDIINKFVDNELTKNELEHIENLVQKDNKFRSMIHVHKYVHDSLLEMTPKSAPLGFTEIVMNKIVSTISEKYKKNYLFRGVIAILGLILVFSLFAFFYYIGDLAIVKSASETTLNFTEKFVPVFSYFTNVVKTDIFKTVSGLLGFVILIGFYFNYNTHKQLKETLKKL